MGLHGFICGLVDQWSVFASVCPKLSFCLAAPFLLCAACFLKKKSEDDEDGDHGTIINSREGSKDNCKNVFPFSFQVTPRQYPSLDESAMKENYKTTQVRDPQDEVGRAGSWW